MLRPGRHNAAVNEAPLGQCESRNDGYVGSATRSGPSEKRGGGRGRWHPCLVTDAGVSSYTAEAWRIRRAPVSAPPYPFSWDQDPRPTRMEIDKMSRALTPPTESGGVSMPRLWVPKLSSTPCAWTFVVEYL